MVIDIRNHYFRDNANGGELNKLGKFQVGEIVTDWNGDTSCILMIFKDGNIRVDSNGMGEISKLKKVKSKRRILEYLNQLHVTDMRIMQRINEIELEMVKS